MTIERAKEIRRAESERAAGILGAEVRFFDAGDYPLRCTDALVEALVQEYRTCRPDVVLTHSYNDPYNPDHPAANRISLQTRVYAQAEGYPLPGPALGAPPVFMFEPHQPEQCAFKPEVLLDVTPVWERKRAGDGIHGGTAASRGLLLRPEPPARDASRAQLGAQRHYARGSVSARLSAGDGRARMTPTIVRDDPARGSPRHQSPRCIRRRHRTRGARTDRAVPPVPCGRSIGSTRAGSAVTVLCGPGDNLMIHAAIAVCSRVTCSLSPPLRSRPTDVR